MTITQERHDKATRILAAKGGRCLRMHELDDRLLEWWAIDSSRGPVLIIVEVTRHGVELYTNRETPGDFERIEGFLAALKIGAPWAEGSS